MEESEELQKMLEALKADRCYGSYSVTIPMSHIQKLADDGGIDITKPLPPWINVRYDHPWPGSVTIEVSDVR